MFCLRREQGRLREALPMLQHFVRTTPKAQVWQPGLALLYAELDMRAECRAQFDSLPWSRASTAPRDSGSLTVVILAAELCVYLNDAARAAQLYPLLQPYSGTTPIVDFGGPCLGSIDRLLGKLDTAERWEACAPGSRPRWRWTSRICVGRAQPAPRLRRDAAPRPAPATARPRAPPAAARGRGSTSSAGRVTPRMGGRRFAARSRLPAAGRARGAFPADHAMSRNNREIGQVLDQPEHMASRMQHRRRLRPTAPKRRRCQSGRPSRSDSAAKDLHGSAWRDI
jgi:hypothetical protein